MRVVILDDGPLSENSVIAESDDARLVCLVKAWIESKRILEECSLRKLELDLYQPPRNRRV